MSPEEAAAVADGKAAVAPEGEPEAVLTERRGNVLLIILNRPQVRNAVNGALAAGVAAALDQLDEDDGLSVGVLTGAGGFFSAGMDLGAFVRGESSWFRDRGFAGITQRASRKPLIAAIEGFALAGGMEIALACDLIVAAKGAKLGIPEAKRSLVAAGGALLRLPRRMPYHVVMELALTGDPLPAERFHELGVVNRLADPGSAVDVALELAGQLAANGPLALTASKQILQEQFDWSSSEMWEKQAEITAPVFASEDAKEGSSAFKEKRAPVWRGA
jgi:enoyl-CoA hydratase